MFCYRFVGKVLLFIIICKVFDGIYLLGLILVFCYLGLCGCLVVYGVIYFDCLKVYLVFFFVGILEGFFVWRVYVEGGFGCGYLVILRCIVVCENW